MELEDEVISACKRMIDLKIENTKAQRRALLDKCMQSAVNIIERCNENFRQTGITSVGDYISSTGGYEARYGGESINGSITIVDSDYDPAGVKAQGKLIISVICRAHSCVTQSNYEGEIPESEVRGFVEFATRQPTLIDRWKRMTGEYHGEF